MSVFWEVVGWSATVLLVGAYALVATRRLDAHHASYHVLNLVGGISLAAYSIYKSAWPQFALNLFWGGVAVVGIAMSVIAARRLSAGDPAPGPAVDEQGVREG